MATSQGLLGLPMEMLMDITGNVPDIPTLHNLIQTAPVFRAIFDRYPDKLVVRTLDKSYPDYVERILDITDIIRTEGQLTYTIEFSPIGMKIGYPAEDVPDTMFSSSPSDFLAAASDLIIRTENLASCCDKSLFGTYVCRCHMKGRSIEGPMRAMFNLQFSVTWMRNLQIQPEAVRPSHVPIRGDDRTELETKFKFAASTARVALVKSLWKGCMKGMWHAIDSLQKEYTRLHEQNRYPLANGFMDLLFYHPGNQRFWTLNPKEAISRELHYRYGVDIVQWKFFMQDIPMYQPDNNLRRAHIAKSVRLRTQPTSRKELDDIVDQELKKQ